MKCFLFALMATTSCIAIAADAQERRSDDLQGFRKSLTFFASFDNGFDADFAVGDKQIYSVKSQEEISNAKPAAGQAPEVRLAPGEGRNGGTAIEFKKKTPNFVFFQAEKNIHYRDKDWSGTFSFWLKVDPVKGLAPGYTDPVQLTDANYDDSAIWVDFTKSSPREFRLGMKCDKAAGEKNDEQTKQSRVSAASTLPFSADTWTHVVITYSALNTDAGQGRLYFDGVEQASVTGIDDPFTWDLSKAKIRLGVAFVGMIDELAAFDKELTAKEIQSLHKAEMTKLLAR